MLDKVLYSLGHTATNQPFLKQVVVCDALLALCRKNYNYYYYLEHCKMASSAGGAGSAG